MNDLLCELVVKVDNLSFKQFILQTTVVAEEIWMNFVANKDEAEKEQEQSSLDKLKGVKGVVKCRFCKEDHWTTQCPYKVVPQKVPSEGS